MLPATTRSAPPHITANNRAPAWDQPNQPAKRASIILEHRLLQPSETLPYQVCRGSVFMMDRLRGGAAASAEKD
jgi:hypothetical protein